MTKLIGSLIGAAVSLMALCASAEDPSPAVTDEEYAQIIEDLDLAQDTLVNLITGMTDEQWKFKQNPDRWSVAECVEHIVGTQHAILDGIQATLAGPRDPQWYERTKDKNEFVRQTVSTRNPGGAGSPFKVSYEFNPKGDWDRGHGIAEFFKAQGALRAFVETMPREIKDRTMMNPFPQIGWMNLHDWLTLAPLHVIRHSKQIAEVQQDAKYPEQPPAANGH